MSAPKIRDTYVTASKGWWVIDDFTGKKLEAPSYKALRGIIQTHRKSNGKPDDLREIGDMIARQVCAREHSSFCEPWPQGLMGAPVGKVQPEPNFIQMTGQFLKHVAYWLAKGAQLRTQEQMQECLDICKKCPSGKYEEARFWLAGKCKACGCCTELKPWLATEGCPLGHWKLVSS